MAEKNMYRETLEHIGFAEQEITIYLLLLEHGEQTAADIADHTNIQRTYVYHILDDLMDKKAVEKIKKDKRNLFRAQHPVQIKEYIQEQRDAFIQSERSFDAVLPQFISDFNLSNNQPGLYIFEGKEGVIKAYNELLQDKLDIDSIEDKGEMAAFIPDYFPTFIRQRMKYKIFNRVIAPSTNTININSKKELRETRFVSVKDFPFEMDIKISARKIVMTTFKKDTAVGVVMVHPEIVKNYQILFNYLWKIAGHSSSS